MSKYLEYTYKDKPYRLYVGDIVELRDDIAEIVNIDDVRSLDMIETLKNNYLKITSFHYKENANYNTGIYKDKYVTIVLDNLTSLEKTKLTSIQILYANYFIHDDLSSCNINLQHRG